MRRSLPLHYVRAVVLSALVSALALLGPPAEAQLGSVTPAERLHAGTRVNAFVTWEGAQDLEGLTLDLPSGWRLVEASAVRLQTNEPVRLRTLPSSRVEHRFHALTTEPLRGAHRFILGLDVGSAVEYASVTLIPVRRRQEDNRLVLMRGLQTSWSVSVAEAPQRGRGRAFQRAAGADLLMLERRALPSLRAQEPFTIEAWLRTTGLDEVVLSTWDGVEAQTYPVEWLVDAQGRLVVYRGEPGHHVGMQTARPVADGRWHHVALAHDPERGWARLFLDGNLVDSLRVTASDLTNNALPLSVGGRRVLRDGSRLAFSGQLDELRFWNRARSRDEVRYTMRRQLDESVDGLVRLGFDEPVSPSLTRGTVGRIYASSDLSFSYPVEALSADVQGTSVRVTWETKDRENERFTVERSTDGRTYEAVGTVRLSERIAEAADGTMRFAYTDALPESPLLYYRIRQRFGGAPDRLSGALKLGLGADGTPLAVIEGNSPNPFRSATTISFSLERAAPVRLSVWDVSGSRVAVLVDQTLRAGRHDVRFDAQNLPSGVYFVRLHTAEMRLTHKVTLAR
ncbi:MAG: T9SS type A sorting domain-containing protein [Rhodothermaceae bacterium]|nr:T9SS type A sorting domain-containing protein [Rhodothermaceae bacterium]